MPYTVVWDQAALDELASIWVGVSDRAAVTTAANQVEQTLRRNPHQQGEDFYGDRLLVIDPLSIVFSVNDADRIVRVLRVW
jgi:hypothetical protein